MNNDVYTFRLVADYVQRVANIDIGKELLDIDLNHCIDEKLEDIFSLWNSDQVLTYTAYFTMYTTKYKFVLMTLKFYFDCLTDIKIIGS